MPFVIFDDNDDDEDDDDDDNDDNDDNAIFKQSRVDLLRSEL
jgi:hypothetical protein